MSQVSEVIIPRVNASDDSVVLMECLFSNGDKVQEGDVIALCESSKETFEVQAPLSGFVHFGYEPHSQVEVGSSVAVISSQPDYSPQETEGRVDDGDDKLAERFSKSARALMKKHNLSPSLFQGLDLVRRQDIEAYLDRQEPSLPQGSQLVLVGGSGHAKTCLDILKTRPEFEVVGIVDDGLAVGFQVLGYPVLGDLKKLPDLYQQGVRKAIIGIGFLSNLTARAQMSQRVRKIGFEIPPLIHRTALIEPSARLGSGVQIHAGAIVGTEVMLHQDCVVNSGAIVSHDCVIKSNAHLAPGCILAGNVTVGTNTLVGMGCSVFLGLELGDNLTIKNGQNVFHNR